MCKVVVEKHPGCLQDEDESDEEGDMDLKDMDSAFQLSPVASPTY